VIFRSDGYILTNNHVVGNADQIMVRLNDKRQFKGTVVGKDSFTDLALVKIDAKDLPAARFGDSKTIRVGDWAIAIGSPLSLDHTVTLGIISALSRSIDELKNNVEFIQTDAAINPGNSGGPLLNIRGEVIGINTAIRGDGQNIGFAIPINVAREVAEQLLSNGKIDRPYLGVYMQELDEKLTKSLAVPQNTKGVVVAGLQPDGPAERASIAQGDILEKVDGKPVATPKEVQQIVRSHKPGDSIPFIILRDGKALSITVKVGTYPSQDARQ
jgi:S1-C subfamily serine protease